MTELTTLGPPASWTEVDTGMSNFDHAVDSDAIELLQGHETFGRHAAINFNGLLWFQDGSWHEQVWVFGSPVATYSAEAPEELMQTVNDEHGWE